MTCYLLHVADVLKLEIIFLNNYYAQLFIVVFTCSVFFVGYKNNILILNE